MAEVVIIGAGLTGISAAYHFECYGFDDYLLFERESAPGGLCRSIMQDGFTFDYTGHLLHINDSHFRSLIEKHVGFENLHTINRRSFIYSHNTYTKYPFQVNLFGLPKQVIIDCIIGYINRPTVENSLMFREWIQTNFGEGFGNHFFYPYQSKIFATDIDELTASWTSRFVPSTSLSLILEGALSDESNESIGYNAQFFYPKEGGIFSWVKQLAHQIKKPIQTDHYVKSIDIKKKIITFTNGNTEKYSTLITTMPLDCLLDCIIDLPSTQFKQVQTKLRCNKVLNFNLGINKPQISDKHWIYYPEKKYPFYRIGFTSNFSAAMAPENCSSLYGEFAYVDQNNQWLQETLKKSLDLTKELFGISDTEILTECIIPISHAYVIFDQWRDMHLSTLLKQLENYDIYSVGRYGAWKYASMQEGILDGKEIAEKIIPFPIPFIESTKELR